MDHFMWSYYDPQARERLLALPGMYKTFTQASTDRFVPDACLFTPGSLTFDSLFEMAHHPIYSVHPRLVGKSQGDQSKTY